MKNIIFFLIIISFNSCENNLTIDLGEKLSNTTIHHKKNGKYKVWYINGKIKLEGNYQNELKEGLFKKYNKKGELTDEGLYRKGIKEGFLKDIKMVN